MLSCPGVGLRGVVPCGRTGKFVFYSRMNISIIMDILVFRLYGYIGYIEDILTDILIQNIGDVKINKNSENIKNYIRSIYIYIYIYILLVRISSI